MSLAIKFGDVADPSSISGAVFFNVVTEFNRKYDGKVTEHPIEAGAHISDHFISSNPKISIRGVISSVDFSPLPSIITLDGDPVKNNKPAPSPVSVGGLGGTLRQMLPDVVSQFLPQLSPTVTMDQGDNQNYGPEFEKLFKDLINGLYYNQDRGKWENRMTPAILYEINGINATPYMEDLIVTNFDVEEDSETGDVLSFSMTLEQVRFVTLESAEAPKPDKNSKTQRQTEPTKDKGNANSTASVDPPNQSPGSVELFRRAGISIGG